SCLPIPLPYRLRTESNYIYQSSFQSCEDATMCRIVVKPFFFICGLVLAGCSPPPPPTPSLTPQNAAELLHYNNRAENWLKFVKKHDSSCGYKLDLPDQSSHPAAIDL